MELNEVFNFVVCAIGSDGHLLNTALALSCGHFICKKCVPTSKNYQFKCHKCNETNQMNLSLCKESDLVKFYMNKHIAGLSKIINEKIKIEADIFKDPTESLQEFYDMKIEQIRYDIDVRTDSLINELHDLKDKLLKQLDDNKLKIQEHMNIIKKKRMTQSYTDYLKNINFNLEAKTLNELYDIEKTLLDIHKKNEFFKIKPFQLIKTLCKFVSEYKPIKGWELLYRASADGFEASAFHRKCDNIPNTVTLVKSTNGYVFGGFTTQVWDSSEARYKQDNQAFIFSLINRENKPLKFLIKPSNIGSAIYCNSDFGPSFGAGHDFCVCNSADSNSGSFANFGHSYYYSGGNDLKILAGSYIFNVSEIEVYTIDFF